VELNVEKPGRSTAKVTLTVSPEEFRKELDHGLRQAGRSIRMKGFRPGKIPLRIVEKQHGEKIRHEVKQLFISRAYEQAVEQEGLKPIAHPRVDLDGLVAEEGGEFKLEFEISLRPEVILAEYGGLRIESELEPVLAQEVESAIEDLRRGQSHTEPVDDEGLTDDGMALCDLTFLHGEDAVFEREGLRLSPLTAPPGVEPEVFKEALTGAKDKDVITIDMTLPDTVEDEALRGKPGTCRIAVQQAYKMVAPPDEELLKLLEADSMQAMKEKLRDRLAQAKEEREQARIESALLDRVLRETDIDLPEALIAEQTESRLSRLHGELEEQGVDHDEIHRQVDEQREQARKDAEHGLKALLIVETIAEEQDLLVTGEELETELAAIAERNKVDIAEVRRYYAENNLSQQMAIEVLERKVRKFLRENANVEAPS